MNKLVSIQSKAIILIAITFGIIIQSCTKNQNSAVTPVKQTASGEDMFKGIFLLQGTYGSNINALASFRNDLESLPASVQSQRVVLAQEIVAGINTIDPTYFNRLKSTIEGKNYSNVSAIMTEGSKLYVQAGLQSKTFGKVFETSMNIADKVDISKFDIKTEDGRNKLRVAVNSLSSTQQTQSVKSEAKACLAGAAVVAALVWEVVAIVNVALVLTVYTKAFAISGTQSSNVTVLGSQDASLTKETLVTQIVSNNK